MSECGGGGGGGGAGEAGGGGGGLRASSVFAVGSSDAEALTGVMGCLKCFSLQIRNAGKCT